MNIRDRGFTLIEILISVAVISLMLVLATISYSDFRTKSSLDASAQEIISNLRLARSKTLASEGVLNAASSYGVHFDSASYALFVGATYDPNNSLNQTFNLSSFLEIVNFDLTTWPDVIFQRVSGNAGGSGSVKVRKVGSSEERVVKIDISGNAYIPTANYGTTGGVNDFRHTHFDYGTNINTVTESITLAFYDPPNPDVVQVIPISSNLDSNNHFNWSGAINVNGSNQKLTIHTHRLNSLDTQFTILRDQANNKGFDMRITGCAPSTLIVYTTAANANMGTCTTWVSNLQKQ